MLWDFQPASVLPAAFDDKKKEYRSDDWPAGWRPMPYGLTYLSMMLDTAEREGQTTLPVIRIRSWFDGHVLRGDREGACLFVYVLVRS